MPAAPYDLRMVVLDATSPGTCALPQVIAPPGVRFEGQPQVTIEDVRLLSSSPSNRLHASLAHLPLVPEDNDLMPDIRAQLIDGHAIVLVVSYSDVIVNPDGRRARAAEERVRDWLLLVAEIAAPEQVTLVVDGVKASNSNPQSRLAWTRRHARQALKLRPDWPPEKIIEMSSHSVLEVAEAERANKAPPGQQAHAWDSYGITELLDQTLGLYDRDPVRWFTESALRRAKVVFGWAEHDLGDRLKVRPSDGRVDPDQVLLPHYARQRQSWLLALGLGGRLCTAIPQIDAALRDLADP